MADKSLKQILQKLWCYRWIQARPNTCWRTMSEGQTTWSSLGLCWTSHYLPRANWKQKILYVCLPHIKYPEKTHLRCFCSHLSGWHTQLFPKDLAGAGGEGANPGAFLSCSGIWWGTETCHWNSAQSRLRRLITLCNKGRLYLCKHPSAVGLNTENRRRGRKILAPLLGNWANPNSVGEMQPEKMSCTLRAWILC